MSGFHEGDKDIDSEPFPRVVRFDKSVLMLTRHTKPRRLDNQLISAISTNGIKCNVQSLSLIGRLYGMCRVFIYYFIYFWLFGDIFIFFIV